MNCPNCGKELSPNAAFCGGCGTRQAPRPVRKRRKKKSPVGLIAAAAAVVIVLLLGAVLLLGGNGNRTVYRLKYIEKTPADGDPYITNYSIDPATGNLTSIARLGEGTRFSYDQHGNLQSATSYDQYTDRVYDYDNTYDKDGLLESCEVSYMDQYVTEWEFTWEDGNLVRACQEINYSEPETWHLWQEYEYDEENRLETEYWCWAVVDSTEKVVSSYNLMRYEYAYDEDGNLTELCYSCAENLDEDDVKKPSRQDYEEVYTLELEYDREGRLESYELNSDRHEEDGDVDYDKKGNRESIRGSEFEYDTNGNLIFIEEEDGTTMELVYEKTTLGKDAADRYHRWISLKNADPLRQELRQSLTGSHYYYEVYYYYLIPNPVW